MEHGDDTDSWRRSHALRTLEETVSVYRAAANEMASRVTALKRELAHLRAELSTRGALAGITVGEVWLVLDETARERARAATKRTLDAALPPEVREDAALIAGELASDTRRSRGHEVGGATLRITHTTEWVRVELEHAAVDAAVLIGPPAQRGADPIDLGLIPLICDRWGAERDAADRMHVWAQISVPASGA
jgi:hypothetical protein